jgi:hypothetical protein
MLHMAHASRFHWEQVGTPANLARGEWLCSRVYAVLRRPEPCLHHAARGAGDLRAARDRRLGSRLRPRGARPRARGATATRAAAAFGAARAARRPDRDDEDPETAAPRLRTLRRHAGDADPARR